jgi:4-alpha-glucanotransferase
VRALKRLAAAHGVLTSYYGVEGLSRARPEALLAVLRRLGAPVESVEDADEALRERREETARRLVPPVVTLWDDLPPAARLTHLAGEGGRARATITLEDGSRREQDLDLETLPLAFERHGLVDRRITLPRLPPGYHRLEVDLGGERHSECTLLSAPARSYRGAEPDRARRWGLFAPLYALGSESSLGVGDFSDLSRFADVVSSHRGSFAATLPLLATFIEEPSPYSPASRRFWNELFVDPRLAPEWESVRSFASHPDFLSRLEAVRREPLVDYAAVGALKRPLLEAMSREAIRVRRGFLEELARTRPDAVEYARFRAAAERRGTPWPSWSEPPPRADFADGAFLYHFYGQALAEEQIAGAAAASERKGVRFYFDMPLGVHGHGFDTWSSSSLFAKGAEVGAPPDAVFPDGQSWGFPPVLPSMSRAEGHRYWRECLAHVMRHAGLLRIDHVMGMHRQFWIPRGFEKRDGVYVRYPSEELHAVASIESHRHRSELVGENLGIVPEAVNRALERHRWREIYVLQFRLTGNPEKPFDLVPPNVVASFNTHDTPTFAGFRRGRDLDDGVEAGLLDREKARELSRARAAAVATLDAHLGLGGGLSEISREGLARWLQLLLGSDADLVAITLEDLWLEEEPQNVPGRVDRPNWRRKLRHSLSSLPPEVVAILAGISRPA